ncbi:hypothetical protein B9H04_06865 [Halorubrum ezzemoulense DSM 17463]|uniref:Uncharacterized protein n=1 Tax=Halorubrum ezzemoulense DSM 17463 TaxID=1121945 RepID=A0A1X4H970_HALEZ|nr:hypothetical protein B9H04_06865 [Halorubrum ezzemoulense DSM 17463]
MADGTVYVGSRDNKLYVMDLTDVKNLIKTYSATSRGYFVLTELSPNLFTHINRLAGL